MQMLIERIIDKIMVLDGQSKLEVIQIGKSILWWWDNIMNSHSPIIQELPTTYIYTDASPYGWGVSCNFEKCRGQFSTN